MLEHTPIFGFIVANETPFSSCGCLPGFTLNMKNSCQIALSPLRGGEMSINLRVSMTPALITSCYNN